jgi:hypothetical protein
MPTPRAATRSFVILFVNGTATLKLDAGELRLRVETDYPHDGNVRFTVESAPDEPVTLAIRIPGWAREQPVPSALYQFVEKFPLDARVYAAMPDEDGYMRITERWESIRPYDLPLPMAVRRVLADERVEANRGRVALQRGPLVYCVEAVDHEGQRTDAIVLPDDAKLTTEQRDDLLGGVTVITAEAKIAREPKWGETAKVEPLKLTAIPYYAWANRGDGYMDLWLARTAEAATPLPAKTAADEAEFSASVERPAKMREALRDGRVGPGSDHRATPHFSWPDSKGGTGWVQYDWPEARELSRAALLKMGCCWALRACFTAGVIRGQAGMKVKNLPIFVAPEMAALVESPEGSFIAVG